MKVKLNEKGQAVPTGVVSIQQDAFMQIDHTEIRWLTGGAAMINARGTIIMIDPVLEGFDMPLVYNPPISVQDVPGIDGLLVTHIDNDHFSRMTIKDMLSVTKSLHATRYVTSVMQEEGMSGVGHDIGESFQVGKVRVKLTPAWHNWQNESEKWKYREWKREDFCGFWLDTPDGTIWMPGDSRLLEEHLTMEQPDVILLDFADNDWHITLDGAVKMCAAYPDALLIPIHWGSVDAPDFSPFNGNPMELAARIVNPERLHVLLPGEKFEM